MGGLSMDCGAESGALLQIGRGERSPDHCKTNAVMSAKVSQLHATACRFCVSCGLRASCIRTSQLLVLVGWLQARKQ